MFMVRLFRLLGHVPLPLMQRLGALMGWLTWLMSGTYRRRFEAHASAAGFTPTQYRPAVAAIGTMVAELPWLWLQAELDARLRAMAGGVPMQVLLLDPAGRVLAGPAHVSGAVPWADLSEGGRYVLGRPAPRTPQEPTVQMFCRIGYPQGEMPATPRRPLRKKRSMP